MNRCLVSCVFVNLEPESPVEPPRIRVRRLSGDMLSTPGAGVDNSLVNTGNKRVHRNDIHNIRNITTLTLNHHVNKFFCNSSNTCYCKMIIDAKFILMSVSVLCLS